MTYIPMKKAFYDPGVDDNQLYEERFHAPESVHLGVEVSGYPAFFLMTQDVYEAILRASSYDKELLRLMGSLPQKAIEQFAIKNLIDEIVLTNEIEGVNSTRREVHDVLEALEKKDRRKRFHGLVNKYYMLTQNDGLPISTPEDVREIYDELVLREVLESDPGNAPDGRLFRKGPVSVYSSTQKRIHDGILPESKIIESLEKALRFLNGDDAHPLARIAAFHFMFGYIHPFYDGNGRTNRYISSYYLANSHEPIVGYGLSYAIKNRIGEYYKGFTLCEGKLGRGDITPFVSTFCDIATDAFGRIVEALKLGREKLTAYEKAIMADAWISEDRNMLGTMEVLVQAALFSDYGAKIEEVALALEVNDRTARRYVKALEDKGLVLKEKVGRTVFRKANLDALITQ